MLTKILERLTQPEMIKNGIQGAPDIVLGQHKRNVLIAVEGVACIALSPEHTRELAVKLCERARRLDGEGATIHVPPKSRKARRAERKARRAAAKQQND